MGGARAIEPGSVGMRLLTQAQYRNTLADLLNVEIDGPAREDAAPSDTGTIDDLTPYFEAATEVTARLFSAAELPPLLRCPGTSSERDCALSMIITFGARAYRRPLLTVERFAFSQQYDDLMNSGESHTVALQQVLRGLLLSMQFLFRVELTPEATTDNAPYALDSYAMAARLSYWLRNSTPDLELVEAAARDELLTDSGLRAQLQRFLQNDASKRRFAENLGQTWLAVEVRPGRTYPSAAQRDEVTSYLASFFEGRSFRSVLVGELRPSGDARLGLLGLPGVLAAMSFPERAVISHRGAYVQQRVLCRTPPPAHLMEYPELGERPALEAETKSQACQACHGQLDPIGVALDHFEFDGAYRAAYPSGNPIDSRATLPTGEHVGDQASLAQALSELARFPLCLAEQLAAHATGRAITERDEPYLVSLAEQMHRDADLSALAEQIALSAPFRYRRPTPE